MLSRKFDGRLSTNVVYLPVTYPEPPSPLRIRAYAERTPIPTPEVDPAGWQMFPPLKVRGTLFNSRKVEVFVQVSCQGQSVLALHDIDQIFSYLLGPQYVHELAMRIHRPDRIIADICPWGTYSSSPSTCR